MDSGGLSDLVDAKSLQSHLWELRGQGLTITWVSITTASAPPGDEADNRAARAVHAKYLLKAAGVDGRRITTVSNANDMQGSGVRVRFFGY